ncbi:hypothetical protein [Pseudaestuariivita sp.]|uniref:hypothetical protein n=1 Tax=Pseudaestuariivita sp. TaxID=2211669 RepID=UPI004059F760
MPYAEDSFFTLSLQGQVGLVLVAAVLAGLAVLIVWRGAARWPRVLSVALALIVFTLFVWLSPQVYYQYFRLIFDGLPQQVVVKAWPDVGHVWRLLTFAERPSLSHHGQGLLGWVLVLIAVLRRRVAKG